MRHSLGRPSRSDFVQFEFDSYGNLGWAQEFLKKDFTSEYPDISFQFKILSLSDDFEETMTYDGKEIKVQAEVFEWCGYCGESVDRTNGFSHNGDCWYCNEECCKNALIEEIMGCITAGMLDMDLDEEALRKFEIEKILEIFNEL